MDLLIYVQIFNNYCYTIHVRVHTEGIVVTLTDREREKASTKKPKKRGSSKVRDEAAVHGEDIVEGTEVDTSHGKRRKRPPPTRLTRS